MPEVLDAVELHPGGPRDLSVVRALTNYEFRIASDEFDMNHEYQALCRETQQALPDEVGMAGAIFVHATGFGVPFTVTRIARDKEQFEAELQAAQLEVLGITEVRAVVDWDKPLWSLDEFGAAMNIRGGTLCGNKASGKIPWSTLAKGCPRHVALKWIEDSLNEAGKAILKKPRTELQAD